MLRSTFLAGLVSRFKPVAVVFAACSSCPTDSHFVPRHCPKHQPADLRQLQTPHVTFGDHPSSFTAADLPPTISFIILSAITLFASTANIIKGANRRRCLLAKP
jgi:hypothetical protein